MKLVVQVNWFGRDGRRSAHIHGRTWLYRHSGGETPKLELDHARFKAGWGRAAGGHDGEAVDAMN